MAKRVEGIVLEDVRILWPNFKGVKTQFNAEGNRNFTIQLDPERHPVKEMIEDGWNIRVREARDAEEGGQPQFLLQVKVNFKSSKPSRIALISDITKRRTAINEDMAELVDFVDIKKADVNLNAYHWDVNDKQGIKAYLANAFIILNEDELDQKYADFDFEEG